METRILKIRERWDRKEFSRRDGSIGTVQKILVFNDLSLTIWDKEAVKFDEGTSIKVDCLKKKKNRDGYDEWHTSKSSLITVASDMDKETYYESKIISGESLTPARADNLRPFEHEVMMALTNITMLLKQIEGKI